LSTKYPPFGDSEIQADMTNFEKIRQRLLQSIPVWDPSINEEGIQKGAMFVAHKLISLGITDDILLNSKMSSTNIVVKGILGNINSDYVELINMTWGKIPRPE